MKILHVLRGPALSLACIGLLLPHAAFGAPPVAVPPAAEGQPSVGPAPAVADVALHAGGMLLGQVVDQQGLPVANTVVRLRQRDRVVAEIQTDDVGGFSATGLRGGIYQITSERGVGSFRAWAHQTAPPTAHQLALLVEDDQVVRGQFGWLPFSNTTVSAAEWIAITLGAAGLIVGTIALTQVDDDAS